MRTGRNIGLVGVLGVLWIAASACSDSPERRAAAIARWESDPTEKNAGRIGAALEDPDGAVRARAVRAWLSLGAPEAAAVAARGLVDADPEVRAAAAVGVAEAGLREVSPRLAEVLAGDGDETVRREAARALGAVGDVDSVPALGAALDDPSGPVRLEAARALEALGSAGAIEALARRVTEEPDWETRAAIASALGRAAAPQAYVPLRAAASDPSAFVRAAAAAAVRSLRDAGVPESEAVPEAVAYGPAPPPVVEGAPAPPE